MTDDEYERFRELELRIDALEARIDQKLAGLRGAALGKEICYGR